MPELFSHDQLQQLRDEVRGVVREELSPIKHKLGVLYQDLDDRFAASQGLG